jgi:hypothetical protein
MPRTKDKVVLRELCVANLFVHRVGAIVHVHVKARGMALRLDLAAAHSRSVPALPMVKERICTHLLGVCHKGGRHRYNAHLTRR